MHITAAMQAQKMSSWLKNIDISAQIPTAMAVFKARNPNLYSLLKITTIQTQIFLRFSLPFKK